MLYSVKVTVASASIQYRKLAVTAEAAPCKCEKSLLQLAAREHLHAVRRFVFTGTRQKPVYCQRSYDFFLVTCITARQKKGAKRVKLHPFYWHHWSFTPFQASGFSLQEINCRHYHGHLSFFTAHQERLGVYSISDRKALGIQHQRKECQQEWRWLLDDESTSQESVKC